MKVTEKFLQALSKWEGFKTKAYKCSAGKWTIGVGHVILPHETNMITTPITEAKVVELLKADINRFERAVLRLVKVPMKQNEFEALVSFAFNIGEGALAQSTLLKKVNAKASVSEIEVEFLKWNKARDPKSGVLVEVAGLTNRRNKEIRLFKTGEYA